MPTAIWSSLLGEEGREGGGQYITLIKPRDPHLAGEIQNSKRKVKS